jgi:hypothetical protein
MIADASASTKPTGSGKLFPALTIVFAGITLVFAVVAMTTGNRLATLQSLHFQQQEAVANAKVTASTETEAILKKVQQDLKSEKTKSTKLRKQLAAASKELKETRTVLARANQIIDSFHAKSAETAAPEATENVAAETTAPTAETTTEVVRKEDAAPAVNTQKPITSQPVEQTTPPPARVEPEAVEPKPEIQESEILPVPAATPPPRAAADEETAGQSD